MLPGTSAQQRRAADVTWVGAGGSRPRACVLTMSPSAVNRAMRVCFMTGSSYGVVMIVWLLVQTFSGCSGGQFDGM